MIQVRVPDYKRKMCNTTNNIEQSQAYKNTCIARVGVHNDCFLSNLKDTGTYVKNGDREYLEKESLFTPVGGETCNDQARCNCKTAREELEKYHWSYMNINYHENCIEKLKNENCFYEIQNRLGYRFELVNGNYPKVVGLDEKFSVSFKVNNKGYSTLYNKRVVYLVLRDTKDNKIQYEIELKTDPRFWFVGTTTINEEISISSKKVKAGLYGLFLHLPDISRSISKRGEYSIRLANSDVKWDVTTGLNDLKHTIQVK